jgi:hypothetical protein
MTDLIATKKGKFPEFGIIRLGQLRCVLVTMRWIDAHADFPKTATGKMGRVKL